MNQIHFITYKSKDGQQIECACSISTYCCRSVMPAEFYQWCTDDPDKCTCGACKRTKIFKEAKAKRAKP